MNQGIKSTIENDLDEHKKWLQSLIQEQQYETEPRQSPLQNHSEEHYQQEIEQSQDDKKHWDYLYNLNQIKQETREYVQQAKKLQEDKEVMECTFQPKILDSSLRLAQKYGKIDFHKRGEYWAREKEEKIKKIQETKEDKELVQCTFQPRILHSEVQKPKQDCETIKQKSGVDKFLERQKQARAEKQRKLDILNGSKNKVQNLKIKNNDKSYQKELIEKVNKGISKKFQNLNGMTFNEATIYLHEVLQDINIKI